jgi:hypothetical protein
MMDFFVFHDNSLFGIHNVPLHLELTAMLIEAHHYWTRARMIAVVTWSRLPEPEGVLMMVRCEVGTTGFLWRR